MRNCSVECRKIKNTIIVELLFMDKLCAIFYDGSPVRTAAFTQLHCK